MRILRVFVVLTVLLLAGLSLSQMLSSGRAVKPSLPPQYPGVYVFYDWDNLDPAEYPWITGGVLVRRWNQIAVSPDYFDWSHLEDWIAREVSLGKRTILRVSPHDGWYKGTNLDATPSWVYERGVSKVYLSDGAIYPKYWDPIYRDSLKSFIAAFGAQYDGDPRVEAVEMGIGLYGEAFPGPDDPAWSKAGLTEAIWESYVKEIIDAYATAFTKTPLIFMEQFYPQGNFWQLNSMANYAAYQGMYMGYNGLRDEDQSAWSNLPVLGQPGWHSPFKNWVMSGQRMGRLEAHGSFRQPERVYWVILNALDSNATYISLYREDVSDVRNREAFEFANKYVGKTITNTPGVWVALRKETPTLRHTKSNNYGLGLKQYDPDGTSVGVWNVGGNEGRFARRTDQASGRNYLYFNVDDRYIYENPSAAVEVSVTYLDSGYDSWELQYDSISDPYAVAGTITKGNSGVWKKEALIFYDAYLGNRQAYGNDLRLYSREDGDDTFHMIEITKIPLEDWFQSTAPIPNRNSNY